MTDLNDYLDPVSIEKPEFEHLEGPAVFSHNLAVNTESNPLKDPYKYKIAIIGVPEGRNTPNTGCEKGPDIIRRRLYNLARVPGKIRAADLGNIKTGATFGDTVSGLAYVMYHLISAGTIPVIIGGSSVLSLAFEKCFSELGKKYTLASIDSRIDFSPYREEIDSRNYLNKIIYGNKSSISHFVNIGYQTYLNDYQSLNRLLKRKAELIRIGDARGSLHLTEPLLRDSDVIIFDIAAVRQSDAPGTKFPSPNGFYGEEICLLARYAGISDTLKAFGLFEVNPDLDNNFQTSGLAAQILWFFIEGSGQKQYEAEYLNDQTSGRFTRFHVKVADMEDDMIFVRSNITDRWWMEIITRTGKVMYASCSHEDYLVANRNEIPERWFRAVEKFNS